MQFKEHINDQKCHNNSSLSRFIFESFTSSRFWRNFINNSAFFQNNGTFVSNSATSDECDLNIRVGHPGHQQPGDTSLSSTLSLPHHCPHLTLAALLHTVPSAGHGLAPGSRPPPPFMLLTSSTLAPFTQAILKHGDWRALWEWFMITCVGSVTPWTLFPSPCRCSRE